VARAAREAALPALVDRLGAVDAIAMPAYHRNMLTVKGKCDGKLVRLERPVPVKGEVDVLVEFPEGDLDQSRPASQRMDLVDFLLSGPTFSEEEMASIEAGREELRRWRR
jgi:hypothetical protein